MGVGGGGGGITGKFKHNIFLKLGSNLLVFAVFLVFQGPF